MQTFLPYVDFNKTMDCLDKRRCWKQVLEARQILATLGVKLTKASGGPVKPSHVNHPIHKMWEGYEEVLMHYHDVALMFSKIKWSVNTNIKSLTYISVHSKDSDNLAMWKPLYQHSMPWFMGYKPFHDAHKSNLLRKNPEWYSQFNWNVPNDLPYIWRQDEAISC